MAESLRQIFANAFLVRQEEGEECELQVGRTVTKAPRYMRTQLWLGVLQRHPGLGHKAARQYQVLLRESLPEITADDIAKDVGRTFPNIPQFKVAAGQNRLERVLRAYAAYDPEVNYCQGMNFLAALLLIWMPSEAEAFGGLVVLMEERGLRDLYKKDMSSLQARLWQIGKLLPPRLADHLEANCVLPVLYASPWLLTAFSADFPLFWSSRIMDVILTDCYIEPMMKVVVGLMRTCAPALLKSNDMEKIVRFIKVAPPRWPYATLQEVLTDSLAMDWSPEQATLLRQTEGTESVIQAVARVQQMSQAASEGSPADSSSLGRSTSHLIAPASPLQKKASLAWAKRMSSTIPFGAALAASGSVRHSPDGGLPLQDSDAPRENDEAVPLSGRRAPCRSDSHLLDEPPVSAFSGSSSAPAATSSSAGANGTIDGGKAEIGARELEARDSLAQRSSQGSFGDFTGSADVYEPATRPTDRAASGASNQESALRDLDGRSAGRAGYGQYVHGVPKNSTAAPDQPPSAGCQPPANDLSSGWSLLDEDIVTAGLPLELGVADLEASAPAVDVPPAPHVGNRSGDSLESRLDQELLRFVLTQRTEGG